MLEVTRGESRNQVVARQLTEMLQRMNLDGSLYIGYPVLATADETITVDALLVSRQHGLVIFLLAGVTGDERSDAERIQGDLDRTYVAMENALTRHDTLRRGRDLAFSVNALAVVPVLEGVFRESKDFVDLDAVAEQVRSFEPLHDPYYVPLQAALQRVTTIKPRKRRQKATTPKSRGFVLKSIEREIANLDQWQKRAAIESAEGPQRIRGLAGSGKTIVLALKAAYLHVQHPDWVIALTFHTRALYQQFEDLIRRFTFEHLNDEPNWDNLRLLHAWGGRDREGIYTQIARHAGVSAQDYLYARNRYGMSEAFNGVCSELLSAATAAAPEPMYDAVLIDEAQDLPIAFFRLVYTFCKEPKRVVWAYDDLQRLSETSMPTVEEMFGTNESGIPLVRLGESPNGADQDIILKVCYRNPPWTLTVAHACGLGIYRAGGLIQHFDDPSLWDEIGYRVLDGSLEFGEKVTLERATESYPEYFHELLNPDDAVQCWVFQTESEQAHWLARSIRDNLDTDELEHDDILVVLPNAYSARRESVPIVEALDDLRILAHLAGVTSSRDEIFDQQSIALANIYRSKGNEAAVVYIVNAQQCLSGTGLITLRNTLFTAITRSRAWVRICGWGPQMETLAQEIRAVIDNDYRLRFKIPTPQELSHIRKLYREPPVGQRERVRGMTLQLRRLLQAFDRGEVDMESLPLDVRAGLAKYLSQEPLPDYDDDSE